MLNLNNPYQIRKNTTEVLMVIPAHHVVISFSNQFPEMDRSTGNKKSLVPRKKFKHDCDYQCFQSIALEVMLTNSQLPLAVDRAGYVPSFWSSESRSSSSSSSLLPWYLVERSLAWPFTCKFKGLLSEIKKQENLILLEKDFCAANKPQVIKSCEAIY